MFLLIMIFRSPQEVVILSDISHPDDSYVDQSLRPFTCLNPYKQQK